MSSCKTSHKSEGAVVSAL